MGGVLYMRAEFCICGRSFVYAGGVLYICGRSCVWVFEELHICGLDMWAESWKRRRSHGNVGGVVYAGTYVHIRPSPPPPPPPNK